MGTENKVVRWGAGSEGRLEEVNVGNKGTYAILSNNKDKNTHITYFILYIRRFIFSRVRG